MCAGILCSDLVPVHYRPLVDVSATFAPGPGRDTRRLSFSDAHSEEPYGA